MNVTALEYWAKDELGLTVSLEVAKGSERSDTWSQAERLYCANLPTTARQTEWERGRTALKRLLQRLELPLDSSQCTFPHSRFSLTHSGDQAVAVGCEPSVEGLGIDLEYSSGIPAAAQRFFLGRQEIDYIQGMDSARQDRERVRLWTIKEAVFKADLHNGNSALSDYRLCMTNTQRGWSEKRDGRRFIFISRDLGTGFISLAIHIKENTNDRE